jgi:MerR family copper efflux transcriptional regulator
MSAEAKVGEAGVGVAKVSGTKVDRKKVGPETFGRDKVGGRANARAVNIGEASRRSAVSAKMIRHYESCGLLPKVARTEVGYRQYDDAAIHTLRFIRRARDLGFSMKEIENLLALWRNRRRASSQVKRIAMAHADDLQRRIDGMQAMRRTLEHLAGCCAGDDRPDCPILDDLAGSQP